MTMKKQVVDIISSTTQKDTHVWQDLEEEDWQYQQNPGDGKESDGSECLGGRLNF